MITMAKISREKMLLVALPVTMKKQCVQAMVKSTVENVCQNRMRARQ